MYATAFLVVRRRLSSTLPGTAAALEHGNFRSSRAHEISRADLYMILYPLIYILSTLPLGAGRISSLVGNRPSNTYLVVAGSLMACSGWMNCLVYSFTRRIFHTTQPRQDQDPGRTPSSGGEDNKSTITAIEMSPSKSHNSMSSHGIFGSIGSTENMIAVTKVGHHTTNSMSTVGVTMERTWEVITEDLEPDATLCRVHGLGHHSCVLSRRKCEMPRSPSSWNLKTEPSTDMSHSCRLN